MTTASKIDFEFELQAAFDFFGQQFTSGYKMIGTTLLRIKDHAANYAYFVEDAIEGSITKIVSVNFTNSSCKNIAATTKEEFLTDFPNVEIIEINFDFEDYSIEEATALINSKL